MPATQIAFEPEWETVFLGETRPSERVVLDAAMLVGHAAVRRRRPSELRATERLVPTVAVHVSVAEPTYTVTTVAAPGSALAGVADGHLHRGGAHAAATGGAVLRDRSRRDVGGAGGARP